MHLTSPIYRPGARAYDMDRVTHFPLVNASHPDLVRHPRFASVTPITVELQPGDALLLPVHWLHQVESWPPADIGHGTREGAAKDDAEDDAMDEPDREARDERGLRRRLNVMINWWGDFGGPSVFEHLERAASRSEQLAQDDLTHTLTLTATVTLTLTLTLTLTHVSRSEQLAQDDLYIDCSTSFCRCMVPAALQSTGGRGARAFQARLKS